MTGALPSNPYADLFLLFDKAGVKDHSSLETLLTRFPSGYYPGPGREEDDPARLCDSFCCRLSNPSIFREEARVAGGIRQFSLNLLPRVPQDSVKKGLFLANMATVFTNHELAYTTTAYQNYYDGSSSVSYSWDLNRDFVRDVYEYRDLIEAGLLRLLPRGCKRTTIDETVDGEGSHSTPYESTVDLLDEIETTRVLSVPPDGALLDAIISRYKQNHQLISLPPLSIPYINNASISNILNLRTDYPTSFADFQRAYHAALLSYIENHRSLNFGAISEEIDRDVIVPQLEKLSRSYRRAISYHRSMMATGAVVASIPVSCVLISGLLLKEAMATLSGSLLPATLGRRGWRTCR